jgi:hypothetical protein
MALGSQLNGGCSPTGNGNSKRVLDSSLKSSFGTTPLAMFKQV